MTSSLKITYFEDGKFQGVLALLVIFIGSGDRLPNGDILAGLNETTTVQVVAGLLRGALPVYTSHFICTNDKQ